MMFWALARVSFRAAKIVSCNKKLFYHGLRSKLAQLFYFRGTLKDGQTQFFRLCHWTHCSHRLPGSSVCYIYVLVQYGTHHSYVLVVHTLRVAENEILKLDFPAKRH
jgi:hypothetical protein